MRYGDGFAGSARQKPGEGPLACARSDFSGWRDRALYPLAGGPPIGAAHYLFAILMEFATAVAVASARFGGGGAQRGTGSRVLRAVRDSAGRARVCPRAAVLRVREAARRRRCLFAEVAAAV